DPYARAVRIGCMDAQHDGDFAGVETHDVAGGINPYELNKTPDEMLVELAPFLRFQDGENPVRGERLLIAALAPHGVVDVGDAAQHRADVQRGSRNAARIPAAVEPQVM